MKLGKHRGVPEEGRSFIKREIVKLRFLVASSLLLSVFNLFSSSIFLSSILSVMLLELWIKERNSFNCFLVSFVCKNEIEIYKIKCWKLE